MLQTIINILESIGNFIYELFYAARQFFTIVSHIFGIFINRHIWEDFLPPALAIVCSVSLLIFIIKIIIGAGNER